MAKQSMAKQSKSGPVTAKPVAPVKVQPGPAAKPNSPVNVVERGLERAGDRLWGTFRRRPYLGAVLAGGIGLGLASLVGAAELAVAVGSGYAALQVLKNKLSPAEAIREAFRFDEKLID